MKLQGATTSLPFGMGSKSLKIGILSDTHGYLDRRVQAVMAHCDALVHAGDVCGGSVLRALQSLCPRIYPIAGNNDFDTRWSIAGEEASKLPGYYKINLPGGMLVVEHGDRFGNNPDHQTLREAWPDARLIVYGHTHKQVLDQSQAPWVVNPGAAGRTRLGAGPSCLVLTVSSDDNWLIEPLRFSLQERKAA